MDSPLIYSQLINLEDSEAESSDELSSKFIAKDDDVDDPTAIYDTLDSYNKLYLNCLQPYEYNNHPFDKPILKDAIICDAPLGIAYDDSLQQTIDQQKESYSWIYNDPTDNIVKSPGNSRAYVNLNDINSFVAKRDSIHHSTLFPYSEDPYGYLDNYMPPTVFEDSDLEDEEDEDEDDEDEEEDGGGEGDDEGGNDDDIFSEDEWPFYNVTASASTFHSDNQAKLTIKIKKPFSTTAINSTLFDDWTLPNGQTTMAANIANIATAAAAAAASASSSSSTTTTSLANAHKYRKSMPNIQAATSKKSKPKTGRRKSTPFRLPEKSKSSNSLCLMTASSSLSSLSSNLKRSMKVSDSLSSLLTLESDLADTEHEDLTAQETEEDKQLLLKQKAKALTLGVQIKKGKNVDKACNHCKRSHLRCDDMRPCRRCIATGKVGCKDVQHKPRGRPKLIKNQ
ncbi:hypothetical protein BCV72DRAFT_222887 [Rhizopus microsporus var. microsporus]|uniref:Zn(2)-C6 fungal-type domain-containing protein n=2 Tax=Rhizopus microsporus TaxID=58291 RepID=A0A2G4SNP0_RHIZD|nr:uncharacterized protein RHIMIDRAFT_260687 [Rhizopus microsporus ATCC 52813]ORE09571.1 hypothetical protein BCV72DRAFT_222887 [Rhizopus microsporus var. microsporus]PHZ10380.1 hypothetical protein RHIMIDRAFT_260687 [Rhizopus microsporus ATCC 52813]